METEMAERNHNQPADLTQLTNLAVRAFWIDGLWDLAFVGVFILLGFWGAYYASLIGFPQSTWFAFQELGENIVWLGLLILIAALVVLIGLEWIVVKWLKRTYIAPHLGYADHRFLMPVDRKVYTWYFVLYGIGLLCLYGLFYWLKGGVYALSVPFIISPAAIYWATGRVYRIRRYQVIALTGLILALALELLMTTPADTLAGPRDFLDVIPAYGSPVLACLVWALMCAISGVIGLLSVRKMIHAAA